jgi:hypothetical protein
VPNLFAPSVLIEPKVGAPLSKVQRKFNALVRKIERLKAQLVEWRETVPRELERIRRECAPLRETHRALRIEFAWLLDRAASDRGMTKNERKKLRHLIATIAAELLAEQPDESLKALHDKHSDMSFDEHASVVNETLKSVVGGMYGIEIGDDVDMDDPEQLAELAEKIKQRAHDEHEKRRAADARPSKRRGSARAAGAEARRLAEAAHIKKSLQEIYRKLAAALHPDRAADDGERHRRTDLMQRVNVAYEAKDLLQLLELQLEAELAEPSRIAELPEARLKHYIKVLEEQHAELQRALAEVQTPIRLELELSPFGKLSASSVIAELERTARHLANEVAALRHDVELLAERSRLKAWLRDYLLPEDELGFDDLMGVLFEPPSRKRRRR